MLERPLRGLPGVMSARLVFVLVCVCVCGGGYLFTTMVPAVGWGRLATRDSLILRRASAIPVYLGPAPLACTWSLVFINFVGYKNALVQRFRAGPMV